MKGRRLMGADTPPRSLHEAARATTMHKQTVTFLMKPRFFCFFCYLAFIKKGQQEAETLQTR